jgi:predicted PurR-regulated permease PerM
MIGNNYYIVLGIIIGILDALPLIGVGAVMVPWSVIYIAMGSYYKAAVLFVMFLLCYFIREYLEPRLMGKHMGITPIASLLSIYVGYGLFGFLGMIVGPLVYVLIREIVGRYSNT